MVIYIGGSIEVSNYAFPGSEDLAKNVCKALGDKNAALISNHGAVAVGTNLREALNVSILMERIAKIYCYSRVSNQINPLPASAIEKERAIFEMYSGLRGFEERLVKSLQSFPDIAFST